MYHVRSKQKPIQLSPAQLRLFDLLNHLNALDFANALKEVHELGTYFPNKDLVNLSASHQVQQLIDAVYAIEIERLTQKRRNMKKQDITVVFPLGIQAVYKNFTLGKLYQYLCQNGQITGDNDVFVLF